MFDRKRCSVPFTVRVTLPSHSRYTWQTGARLIGAIAGVFLFALSLAGSALASEGADTKPDKPGGVNALVYSSSAAELFWSPAAGTRLEVLRNGQTLGVFDSRSLYQPELKDSETYTYTLRSVSTEGIRSDDTVLLLSTQNFSPPIKRVYPSGVAGGNGVTAAQADDPNANSNYRNADKSSAELTITNESDTNVNDVAFSSTSDNNGLPSNALENNPQAQPIIISQGPDNCIARDTNGLVACVRNANAYQQIDIANDIQCADNCCPNGDAIIKLSNVHGLQINGHGHRLIRKANQRQCSLLDIQSGSDIAFRNIFLDDDQSVPGCQVSENCPRMVHIKNASNIAFDQTHISHGKGYVVYVQATNGFRFVNGSLHNSGVLGMYIGHGNNASTNVRITGSTFSDNQTNGLALLGVTGNNVTDNLVADNIFVRNHRKGQWAVLPRYGTGFTGGGQLYVAEASNVTVRNNVIKDGFCDNCYIQRQARTGVSGIELGLPNNASVSNVEISGNQILNLDGFGISQNSNSALRNVSISNNQILNSTSGLHASGVNTANNRIVDTQRFESFESGSAFGNAYRGSVQCSSGGTVQRLCGNGSRFGECAVELRLGSADCGGAIAELTGSSVSVHDAQSVVADGWVNNPIGRWCIEFSDASGNSLSDVCKNLSNSGASDVQSFVGLPTIDARAPGGARSAQLRIYHQQSGARMLIDDLKLSVSEQ